MYRAEVPEAGRALFGTAAAVDLDRQLQFPGPDPQRGSAGLLGRQELKGSKHV